MRFWRRRKAKQLEAMTHVLLENGFVEAQRRPDGKVVYVITPAGRALMAGPEDP